MNKLVPVYYCDICGHEIKEYDKKLHQITRHLDVCRPCQLHAISVAYKEEVKVVLERAYEADSSATTSTHPNIEETTPGGVTLDHTFYASGDIPSAIMTEHY